MAGNDATESDYIYADTLWKSADTLRGQIDAAEYKHVDVAPVFPTPPYSQ
ncbi:hypothetical protein QOU19_17710 [Pseudomonas aeruginosa]